MSRKRRPPASGTDVWVITQHLAFEGMLAILGVRLTRAEVEEKMRQVAKGIDPSATNDIVQLADGSLQLVAGDHWLSAESHRLP